MKLYKAFQIKSGEVVALVGGGGKTTTMFQLANELAPTRRVLTTTSTHISTDQIERSPACVIFDSTRQSPADILPQLDAALAEHGQGLVIGQADPQSGRTSGLHPKTVDALAATGHFDLIINEADGARMLPFKAPAAYEPVIPASTTLAVPVVGLDILGQPLTDDTVHRAELVSRLSGTGLGQPVTADTVTAVLGHPEGGRKSIPSQARCIPLLNKVDYLKSGDTSNNHSTLLSSARQLAAKLLICEQVDSVAIGAVQNTAAPITEVHCRTAIVILAAGGSTRFGSPKQLARWGDKTLLEHAVDTALAAAAGPVVVVLGAEVAQCQEILSRRPVQIIINPAWAEGQSTSMKTGLAALPPNIGCSLFLLVDLPGVTPELINRLIQRHRETLAPLVWPEFEGQRGNPVLFDRTLFPELLSVSGDTGGKPILMQYQAQAERVRVTDAAILRDIDRVEDLNR